MTCNKLFWIKEFWQRVTFRTQDNLVAPIYFIKNNVTEENLVLSNWVWNAHQANPMFVHLHSILRLNGFQFSLGSVRDIFGLHMPWTKSISVNHSGGIQPTPRFMFGLWNVFCWNHIYLLDVPLWELHFLLCHQRTTSASTDLISKIFQTKLLTLLVHKKKRKENSISAPCESAGKLYRIKAVVPVVYYIDIPG